MKSEFMPTIRLEIRPMVMAMVQHMGIENSELSEAINKAIEYEIKKQIIDIPNMVKKEVNSLFNNLIDQECDMYAKEWISPEWVKNNKSMISNFRNTIKSEVMIAITNYVEENRKIIKYKK